jgi:hypothetical protein
LNGVGHPAFHKGEQVGEWRDYDERLTMFLLKTAAPRFGKWMDKVASIGDFNGDGRDDIRWRNDNGLVVNWLGQANGSFADNYANSVVSISNTWHVQAPELL